MAFDVLLRLVWIDYYFIYFFQLDGQFIVLHDIDKREIRKKSPLGRFTFISFSFFEKEKRQRKCIKHFFPYWTFLK